MIYLLLSKPPLFLFFATAPSDVAPYAFIRLQDAAVRDVDPGDRRLVLGGKRKATEGEVTSLDASDPMPVASGQPFGDPRMPLTLCFILADGRYQPFDALWLELEFSTDEDLQAWQERLECACNPPSSTKGPREQFPTEKTPPLAASLQKPMARGGVASGARGGPNGPNAQRSARPATSPLLSQAGSDEDGPGAPPMFDPGGSSACQSLPPCLAQTANANVDYAPTTPVEGMSVASVQISQVPQTPCMSRDQGELIEDVSLSPRRAG